MLSWFWIYVAVGVVIPLMLAIIDNPLLALGIPLVLIASQLVLWAIKRFFTGKW